MRRHLIRFACIPAAIAMYILGVDTGCLALFCGGVMFELLFWKRLLLTSKS